MMIIMRSRGLPAPRSLSAKPPHPQTLILLDQRSLNYRVRSHLIAPLYLLKSLREADLIL